MPKILELEPVVPAEHWWLDPFYRGGVEKRVGWWGMNGYWYVVVFKDGTRTKPCWGTNNEEGAPSGNSN